MDCFVAALLAMANLRGVSRNDETTGAPRNDENCALLALTRLLRL